MLYDIDDSGLGLKFEILCPSFTIQVRPRYFAFFHRILLPVHTDAMARFLKEFASRCKHLAKKQRKLLSTLCSFLLDNSFGNIPTESS